MGAVGSSDGRFFEVLGVVLNYVWFHVGVFRGFLFSCFSESGMS